MHHKFAHEVIAALTAACTDHVMMKTNIEAVDAPIDTFIFIFNESDALLLPHVRINPGPPAIPVEDAKVDDAAISA
jgi:hypothetical protein